MAEDYFGIVGTTQAGAYRVEAVVAEGGFGVVYRAFHDAFQAPVALKCLKIPGQMDPANQAEFLEKFREEAALLFRLSASIPAVVRPLHVDKLVTPDNRFVPFMALEWLEGEGLDAMIMRRSAEGKPPLGLKKVVRLLSPVARALARAHHFPTPSGPISIVHRDLKPDNIFLAHVNGEEVVKIFDFGIAKARSVASQVAGRLSQSGSTMTAFTPGYGAPEQWLPKRFGQTGPWTDVFGLALTVLEAALGKPIIDGDTAAMMGTACDEQRRPTPRNEGLEVSDQIEAVFLAGLAVDPRDRYPDAGQFWDALETALGVELSATPTLTGVRHSELSQVSVVIRREDMEAQRGPANRSTPDRRAGQSDRAPASRRASIPPVSRFGTEHEPSSTPPPPMPEIELDLPSPPSRAASKSSTPQTNKPSAAEASREDDAPARARAAPPPERRASSVTDPGGGNIEIALDVSPGRRPPPGADALPSDGRPGSPRSGAMSASGQYSRVASDVPMPSRPGAQLSAVRTEPSVLGRIRSPLMVSGVGGLLVLVDQIAMAVNDAPLAAGPVRLTYLAAVLIVAGVVMVMKRLIMPE